MADNEDVQMDAPAAAPVDNQEPAVPDSGNVTAEGEPEAAADAGASKDAGADAPAGADKPQSGKAIKALGTAKKGAAKKKGGNEGGSGGEFKVGDVVLAKVKGYPDWPAILIDPKRAPDSVLADQSKKTGQHLAMFMPDANYAWSRSKDLKHLTPSAITAFLSDKSKKRDGELREGYQHADDNPAEWAEEMLQLVADEKAELAAGREDKDELEDDADADANGDKPGKRKRKSEGGESGDAKKDKKAKKAKLSELAKKKKSAETGDEDDEMADDAPAKKAPAKKAAKKDKAAPASASAAAPGDASVEAEGDDPLANDPEAKKIKEWRHKLQRAFLSKTVPSAEEMPTYDDLFKTIEAYDGMTIEYLQHSKIGKVMKKIAALPNIPRNDELKITDRASKFCEQWSTKLEGGAAKPVSSAKPQSNGTKPEANGTADEAAPAASAPAANGHAEDKPAEGGAAEEIKADA